MYSIPDWNSSQSEEDKKKKKSYDIPDWSVTRKDEKPVEDNSKPSGETLIKPEEKPVEKNIFQQVGDAVSGFFNSKTSTPASFQDVIPTPKQKQNSTTKLFQDELQASSEKKNTVRSFIIKATEDKVYTDNVIAQGQAKEGDIKYNQELNTVLSDKSIEDTNLFSGQKALQDKVIEYSKLPSGSDNLSKFKEIVGDINKIKANDELSIQERLDPMVKQVGDDIGKFLGAFIGGLQEANSSIGSTGYAASMIGLSDEDYLKKLEKDGSKVKATGELVSNMFGTLADSTGTIVEGARSFDQLAIEGLPEGDTKNYFRARQIAAEESWANLLGKTDFLKQENDPTKSLFNRTEALFISNEKTKKIDEGGAFLSAEVKDGQLKVSANEIAWKDYLEISGWVLPMGIGGTKIAAKSIATGIGGAMMGLSSSPELFTKDKDGYTTGISSDALNRGLIGGAIGAATPALAEGMSNGIMKVLGKQGLAGTPAQLAIELPTYIGTVYTLAKLTGASDKEALNAAAGIGAFRAIGLISALNNKRFTGDFNKASNEVITRNARGDFYKLTGLEITNETPFSLIKQAYRKAVVTAHPDKGGLEADFIKLQTSYDILTKFNQPIKSNFVKQDKAQEVVKSPLGLAIPNNKSLVEARVNSIPAKVAIEMKPEIQKIQDAYKREVSITEQESVGLERKVQELVSVEEAIAEHPLKPIYKYVKNGELPVVTGDAKGQFASRGDAIIQELRGYGLSYDNAGDSEQVREEIKGLVDLYARRTELRAELGRTDGTIKDAPLVSVYSIADVKDELVKINTKLADFGMKLNENAKLVPIKKLGLPQEITSRDTYQNSNLDSKSIRPSKKIDSVNPTGSVFADYNPNSRVTMELADNITTLDKTMGKSPDAMITIYRGTINKQAKINPGDYVTTDLQLAKDYAGTGKVLEEKVRLGELLDDKKEPLGGEYIYRPESSLDSVKINKSVFTNDEILEIRDFADAKYAKKMNLSEAELSKWEGNIRELLNRKGMNGEKSPSQFTIDIYKILGQANAENITLGRGAIGKTVEQIWEESNSLASPMKGKSYDSQGFIKNEAIKEYSKSVDGISPLGLPEILQLYKDLTGNSPEIKKSLAGALGKAFPGDLGIKLIREIFKDEGLAAKVFAHELGHIIDALPDNAIKKGSLLSKLRVIKDEILTYSEKNKYKEGTGQYRLYEARSEAIRNELLEVADFWRPIELTGKESYRTSNDELFADAFSVLFNAPQLLIEKAPTFWESLKQSMALRPEMFKPLEDIWAIARSGEEAIYKNRYKSIEEMYKGTDKTLEAKIITAKEAGKSILFNLKYGFVDKGQAILDIKGKLNAKGIKTSFEEGGVLDPAVILDEVRMTDSMVEVTIESRYKDFFESLGKDQKVKDLVSQILFLERVAYDPQSASLANPRGFTKSTALAQIESLRKFTDPELLSKADISLKSFREAQDKALADYKASGRIPDDLITEMEMNKNYATFQVGEHMKLFMSGSIRQRIGTFKDIGDPIAYTMLKDAAVVSAIERSKAKNAVADLFVLTEEAEKAVLHFNGKFMEAVTPSDSSKGVIQYIKDGKLEAYYVDKKAVNFFDNTNDDAVRALGKVLGLPNKFYRAIFTSLSVAFQTRNAPKDFIRTWEMRPDQNLGQVIKSFFSLSKNYIKAIPIAKDRTFNIDNPVIDKMKSEKMLTGDYYTMFSDFDSSTETVLDKVAAKFNLTNRKSSIFDKVLSVLTKANTFIEGLPKIATYLEFKDKLPSKETADLVRNYAGTPNFTRSGALSPLSNNIFLFSNIFIQSNKAEWARFSSTDTRGTYILKKILMAVIPTLLMYGISKGLFGDDAQHNLEGASEYDKSNYFVLPIGKDSNGKPINIRLPLVENDKVLHGLLWKGLNFENLGKDGLDGIAGIFSYGASQTPNITPFISSVGAVLQYMSGNNIWDDYRGKNVIPDKEFKAGMEYSYPYFIDYLMKLNGVQGVVPTLVDKVQSKEDKGFWEKAGDIPLIGKAISSWIKTSDYGYIEKEQNMQKEADKEAARKSIARMDILKSKVKEIDYGNSNDFNAKKKEIVNEIIKKELNADPNRLNNEQVKSAKTITNWVEDNLLKNSGTKFLSDFGYATTNDEKARLIVKMYKEKGEEKGREALRKLDQMGVISQDLKDKVNNELRK